MLALALLVSEWESTLSRNTWRRPSDRDRRYFTALIGWGYKPSEVEQIILTKPDPADVIDADPDTKPGDGDRESESQADAEADTEADTVPIDGSYADVDNAWEA
jgi:hypothetical protein